MPPVDGQLPVISSAHGTPQGLRCGRRNQVIGPRIYIQNRQAQTRQIDRLAIQDQCATHQTIVPIAASHELKPGSPGLIRIIPLPCQQPAQAFAPWRIDGPVQPGRAHCPGASQRAQQGKHGSEHGAGQVAVGRQ